MNKTGAQLITEERERQIISEGFSADAKTRGAEMSAKITGNWHRAWRGHLTHYFLAPYYETTACGKTIIIGKNHSPSFTRILCRKCKEWLEENPLVTKTTCEGEP